MKINLDKIIKIYGTEFMDLINDNIDDIRDNLTYLLEIGFNDIEDIFERYTPIFIKNNQEFKEKIKMLVRNLGINYIEIIENNLEILEVLE